ncbi:MAG: hypothetical protein OXE58_08135 [Acidobacteria bacterium]|nr:hypothetical protein [Acidobacteriota bacterium]
MAQRVLVGVGTLIGLLMGFAPGMVPMASLLMVVIGVVYAVMNVDAEDATTYLVIAIAVGGMTGADVLSHIPGVGMQLDMAFDALATAMWAGAAAVVATRLFNRIKG